MEALHRHTREDLKFLCFSVQLCHDRMPISEEKTGAREDDAREFLTAWSFYFYFLFYFYRWDWFFASFYVDVAVVEILLIEDY